MSGVIPGDMSATVTLGKSSALTLAYIPISSSADRPRAGADLGASGSESGRLAYSPGDRDSGSPHPPPGSSRTVGGGAAGRAFDGRSGDPRGDGRFGDGLGDVGDDSVGGECRVAPSEPTTPPPAPCSARTHECSSVVAFRHIVSPSSHTDSAPPYSDSRSASESARGERRGGVDVNRCVRTLSASADADASADAPGFSIPFSLAGEVTRESLCGKDSSITGDIPGANPRPRPPRPRRDPRREPSRSPLRRLRRSGG